MHSPENGGPEMLQELAYRLIVRGDAVHPADPRATSSRSSRRSIEVDGREKQVDTYYFNKKRAESERACR